MALKSLLLFSFLVAAVATLNVEAQPENTVTGTARITGTIFCTLNGTRGNGSRPRYFRNAGVQLQCGAVNASISTDRTNALGNFRITVSLRRLNITSLLSNCSLVVITPLARCNSTLPSVGVLRSSLQLVNNIRGIIFNIVPHGFRYVMS